MIGYGNDQVDFEGSHVKIRMRHVLGVLLVVVPIVWLIILWQVAP